MIVTPCPDTASLDALDHGAVSRGFAPSSASGASARCGGVDEAKEFHRQGEVEELGERLWLASIDAVAELRRVLPWRQCSSISFSMGRPRPTTKTLSGG
jgi:hypothetical protein